MHKRARAIVGFTIVVALSVGLSACAAWPEPGGSCDDLFPPEVAAEILGDAEGGLVQMTTVEPDSVSRLVDTMVTSGVACSDRADGVVLIGRMPMDEQGWTDAQAQLADDGHMASDELGVPGWVSVPKENDDPTLTAGFAWHNGMVYYATNVLVLMQVPDLAEWLADARAAWSDF